MAAIAAAPVCVASAADAPVPVDTILAAYEQATHAADIASIESEGTVSGEGLTGTFHSWRRGDDERDEEHLGPRAETTLRIGSRIWVQDANGTVRELKGVLRRRALTDQFIDTGAFLHQPAHVRFVGFGSIGAQRVWRIEVKADGGAPETLWIDVTSGLPLRIEYIDGDGPTYVDYSDWRDIAGQRIAYRSVTTDGDHAYDVVEQTTAVRVGEPIADERFAPLVPKRLIAAGVQTLPLVQINGHVGCMVTIDGAPHLFVIDSGAQSVLLDSRLAQRLHLDETGALEVRGAVRAGGLRVARLPRLGIGTAALDDLVVSTIDLASGLVGSTVEGILGSPFFATALVQLDFADGVMRFGPPGSFDPPGERIDLDVDREVPEASVRLDGRVDAPFLIDTGNSGGVLLYRPFVDAHPGLVPASGTRSTNYGVGGSDTTYRTYIDELRIGSLPLQRPMVEVILASQGAFADRVDAGNLGLDVLRNFVVTFDLGNAAMYLLPRGGPPRTETTL